MNLFAKGLVLVLGAALSAAAPAAKAPDAAAPLALAGEGRRNPLPSGGYFTWKFDHKPRLGTLIMKIQVYSRDGRQESPFEIVGEYGMPSMRAHDSGPVPFVKNRKGDYLLPMDIVMPGEWEVVVRMRSGKKEVLTGRRTFGV